MGRPRLDLTDSLLDATMKMSEGNVGAVTVIMELMEQAEGIDPQSFMGGMGKILILDTWEIYGSDIYILWNDVCGRDVRRMIMLMRATQLGFFSHVRLQAMAADQTRSSSLTDDEWEGLDTKVCDQLENFKRVA